MILAIDLGSTSFKAGVFDQHLRLMREGQAAVPYRYARGGRVELSVTAATGALRRALPATHGVTAIAITSQAQTFTVLNAHGRAVRPFVSWQDGRAVAARDDLRRRLPDFSTHCSFAEVLPGLLVSQLQHAPLRRGEQVAPLPTYFIRQWTGEAVIDDNLAAMSGLYSRPRAGWWPAALRTCGLRAQQLPRVVPVGTMAAWTSASAAAWGLPVGVPVLVAGNDQTAGGYAAKVHAARRVLITLGTAHVAYAASRYGGAPAPGTVRGPYPGGRHYRMAVESGGVLVNWAMTVLAGCDTFDRFYACAARAPRGCAGARFEEDTATGTCGWTHVQPHHTPADLARAVLEYQARRLRAALQRLGVRPGMRACLAGGGAERPLMRRILRTELQCAVARVDGRPVIGAARMAATALACASAGACRGSGVRQDSEKRTRDHATLVRSVSGPA